MIRRVFRCVGLSLQCLFLLASLAIGWLWYRGSETDLYWQSLPCEGSTWAALQVRGDVLTIAVLTPKAVPEGSTLVLHASLVKRALTDFFISAPDGPWMRVWGRSMDRWMLDLEIHKMMFVKTPLWAPLLACIAFPVIGLTGRSARWWRRKPHGHCQSCGYNLTGNLSGTCPECGSPVPGPTTDAAGAVPPRAQTEQD